MTEQSAASPSSNPSNSADTGQRKRFRLRRPRWTIIAGIIVGASFTGGYLINSFFYCQAQFSCSVSPFWLIVLALIGASGGALFGWSVGKFFRMFYGMTRVD